MTADIFFRFEPENEKIINLGKPVYENSIRSITAGHDGLIWGIAGTDDELTHLFRHDPATGESSDMGMIRAKMPRTWILHRADVYGNRSPTVKYISGKATPCVSLIYILSAD